MHLRVSAKGWQICTAAERGEALLLSALQLRILVLVCSSIWAY